MAKKKSRLSPAAPAKFVFLNRPDTRWKDMGEYHVDLVFAGDDEWCDKLDAFAQSEFKTLKAGLKPAVAKKVTYNSPVKEETDAEGEETGNSQVTFKTPASYIDKTTKEVRTITLHIFDSKKQPITNVPNIGSGSVLTVAFNPVGRIVKGEFYMTLYIQAVQINELKEYMSDGGSYGFGETEGGFEASDNEFDASDEDDDLGDSEF